MGKLGTYGKLMMNTPMIGIRMIYQHNIMGKMMIKKQESKLDTVSDLQRKLNGAEQLILT